VQYSGLIPKSSSKGVVAEELVVLVCADSMDVAEKLVNSPALGLVGMPGLVVYRKEA
jgi:hypothetical protein